MTFKSWYYDNFIASRYDKSLAEITVDFRRLCFDGVGFKAGDTVLDLGAGPA